MVIVGQQDRRHLASRPFLAGDLDGLAGAYPVWTSSPVRPQDVPGALDRAFHEASTARGPAVVAVPSDDWGAPADPRVLPSPVAVRRGRAPDPADVAELAALVGAARCPAIVVGADADGPAAWEALVGLAEHLLAPVWQEAFAARAGFPQDHRLFAGHLPPERATLRAALGAYDLLLVVGAPVFRQYQYSPGELVEPGTTIALVTDDAEDVHHSRADLALLADPALTVTALTAALPRGSDGASLTSDGCTDAIHSSGRQDRRRGRPARPAHRVHRARGPAAGGRGRRRGDPVVAPGPAPPRPGPGAAGVPVRRAGRAGLRGARARSACGWARRRGRSWRSWATARRSTGCRRCGRRRTTGSACSCSSWTTAATRSWTGSRRRPGARRRGRASPRSTWPGSRRRWAARRSGSARTGS